MSNRRKRGKGEPPGVTRCNILIELARIFPNGKPQPQLIDYIIDLEKLSNRRSVDDIISDLVRKEWINKIKTEEKYKDILINDKLNIYTKIIEFVIDNKQKIDLYIFLNSKYHKSFFNKYLLTKLQSTGIYEINELDVEKLMNDVSKPEYRYLSYSPYFIQLLTKNKIKKEELYWINMVCNAEVMADQNIYLDPDFKFNLNLDLQELSHNSLIDDCLNYGEKAVEAWNEVADKNPELNPLKLKHEERSSSN